MFVTSYGETHRVLFDTFFISYKGNFCGALQVYFHDIPDEVIEELVSFHMLFLLYVLLASADEWLLGSD